MTFDPVEEVGAGRGSEVLHFEMPEPLGEAEVRTHLEVHVDLFTVDAEVPCRVGRVVERIETVVEQVVGGVVVEVHFALKEDTEPVGRGQHDHQ